MTTATGIVVSHPGGNTFVRALLAALVEQDLLARYCTTVAVGPQSFWLPLVPAPIRKELLRRRYDLPANQIAARPLREAVRLLAARFGWQALTAHERGWASVDAVWNDFDCAVARALPQLAARAVYCYEDAAFETFQVARRLGMARLYDLPIAYWQTSRRLLAEEAQRLPEWEPTLVGTRDSEAKLARKVAEIELADAVICPSRFVYASLPESIQQRKRCIVAEFGSPAIAAPERQPGGRDRPLRVLFAGSMSQRKGLADLFAAVRLLQRPDVELVVMGSPLLPLDFYRRQGEFTYEPTRPHAEVLRLMASCDLLALPSIVEGRALVQQEAMMCGLPLLVTANAGGEDLVVEGETGFLAPIRTPEALASHIAWCADHREAVFEMGRAARARAEQLTWQRYTHQILAGIAPLLQA